MPKVVYKYALSGNQIQEVLLPRGAQPLRVAPQKSNWFLWALVDPTSELVRTQVLCLGTGHEAPEDIEKFAYLNTFEESIFVWHFFLKVQE